MTDQARRSGGQGTSFPVWRGDAETLALWPRLRPGTAVTIIKADADGEEVTRYDGRVRRVHPAERWIEAGAVWTHGDVALAGLRFVPGDRLLEYFSPVMPFNVFTVFAPNGSLRGWYANVTHPASLRADADRLALTWCDLYLDLIALPDGSHTTQDEDELETSGLRNSDPALYARILQTQAAIIERFVARAYPFSITSLDGDED